MVTYSTNARIEFALNTYHSLSDIQKALMAIPFRDGFTSTAWGLFLARNVLMPSMDFGARPESEGIPKVAIILTDGRANLYPVTQQATDLKNAGVQVTIITIFIINIIFS